jgi:hypothetical protein
VLLLWKWLSSLFCDELWRPVAGTVHRAFPLYLCSTALSQSVVLMTCFPSQGTCLHHFLASIARLVSVATLPLYLPCGLGGNSHAPHPRERRLHKIRLCSSLGARGGCVDEFAIARACPHSSRPRPSPTCRGRGRSYDICLLVP